MIQDGHLREANQKVDDFFHLVPWRVSNQASEGTVPLSQRKNVLTDQSDVQFNVKEVNFLHLEEHVSEQPLTEVLKAFDHKSKNLKVGRYETPLLVSFEVHLKVHKLLLSELPQGLYCFLVFLNRVVFSLKALIDLRDFENQHRAREVCQLACLVNVAQNIRQIKRMNLRLSVTLLLRLKPRLVLHLMRVSVGLGHIAHLAVVASSLIELAEVRVNSELVWRQTILVGSQKLRQFKEVLHVFLINEVYVMCECLASALHRHLDVLILHNSLTHFVKDRALDDVAAEFQILLRSIVRNFVDHFLVLLDASVHPFIHLESFSLRFLRLVSKTKLITADDSASSSLLKTTHLNSFFEEFFKCNPKRLSTSD